MDGKEIAYHIPVMLQESVDALNIKEDGIYFDLTFGGGGHSREILRRLGDKGQLFGFDQDADALQNIPQGDPRFTFVRSNFRHVARWARYYDALNADGILADLGVSSHHFDDASRGFSFRFEGPLDMRMNRSATRTAADVLNTYDAAALTQLFKIYGELASAHRIAKAICQSRENKPLKTIEDLTTLAAPLLPRNREKKEMAKLFQALRIEVNGETEALAEMLQAAIKVLKPGGRLVVLTYHSIEDRMVKNIIRSGNVAGKVEHDFFGHNLSPLRSITAKALTPTEEEQTNNPRSRSAKLRVAERI